MNAVSANYMEHVGPGTHLHRFLAAWGITTSEECHCEDRMAEMDRQGPQWCSDNLDAIADWLLEEARKSEFLGVLTRIVPGAAQVAVRRLLWQAIVLAEGGQA